MATLNVKNLSDKLYRRLRKRAPRAASLHRPGSHPLLSEALEAPEPLPILALRGLGKERWAQIDAGKHDGAERRSWD